jgi:hypothetical protein
MVIIAVILILLALLSFFPVLNGKGVKKDRVATSKIMPVLASKRIAH